jgi:hypothetical protein
MLSAINLLPRKAFYRGLIISARAITSLTERILEITLYTTLQQEIGLKSVVVETVADLGIRAMMEWLICLRSFPDTKKSWTARQKSPPTISQDVLQKKEVYPSGPGALSSSMLNKACLVISLVTGARRDA